MTQAQYAIPAASARDESGGVSLRELIGTSQAALQEQGFELVDWSVATDPSWVRLHRPSPDPTLPDGHLVVLVGHAPGERVAMATEYFVDGMLAIETPRRSLLKRYVDDAELTHVFQEMVDAVCHRGSPAVVDGRVGLRRLG